MESRIAAVAIVIEDRVVAAPAVNKILSQYGEIIVGRMGIPYKAKNLSVISLIVDATADEIGALTEKLRQIDKVHVETAVAK